MEDPEERAALLASGCLSVLYTGLSNKMLEEALAMAVKLGEMTADARVSDPQAAAIEARRAAARGTEVEAALMTKSVLQKAGVDNLSVTDAVMEQASPFRGGNPKMAQDLKRMMDNMLHTRNACLLEADLASQTFTVQVTPKAADSDVQQDSDVDLSTLSFVAVAQDSQDSTLQSNSSQLDVTLPVDAVLDDYLDVSAASTSISVSAAAAAGGVDLGLSSALASAGFTNPGAGGDSQSGGLDTDNSEIVTMTVTVSDDATLGYTLPAGITLDSSSTTSGVTTYVFVGSNQSDWNTFVDGFAVTPAAGFVDDTITVTVNTTTEEANTPASVPGSEVPASGIECDTNDNTKADDPISIAIEVNTVEPPTIESDLVGNELCVKEDGTGSFQVSF